jgi:hypothetical protein
MNTKTLFKSVLLAAALVTGAVSGAVMISSVAYADVVASKALVNAAKAKGIVGEKVDGTLGFVTQSSDSALKAAVAEINAGRREVYQKAAASSGASPEAAGASAFTNIILPNLPAGYYYQDANGTWKQK